MSEFATRILQTKLKDKKIKVKRGKSKKKRW